MKYFYEGQQKLLEKFILYKKNNSNLDGFSYCSLISNSVGAQFFRLKEYGLKYLFSFIKEYLKEILSLGFIKEIKSCSSSFKENTNIILTWGFKRDFKRSYFDKYFQINSKKNKKFKWVILYMSNELPKNVEKNIFLIQILRSKYFNPVLMIKNILFVFLKNKLSLIKFFKNLSSQYILSTLFEEQFKKNVKIKNIKNLLMPYEGQLFQKKIIKTVKFFSPNSKIVGYDHTAPQPLPINLFCDKNSPDLLLVGSRNKMNFHTKFLNWKKKSLKIKNSYRFKKDQATFSSKIYLPYIIEDTKKYLKKLTYLLDYLKLRDFSKFEIRNHPAKLNSKKNINLIKEIDKLKNKKKEKFNKNICIFLGQTTAIPLALENNLTCYSICLDKNFGFYNPKFWKGLKLNRLKKDIYEYKLIKKNTFLKITNKFENLNTIKL